jgi:hypothetical protein
VIGKRGLFVGNKGVQKWKMVGARGSFYSKKRDECLSAIDIALPAVLANL